MGFTPVLLHAADVSVCDLHLRGDFTPNIQKRRTNVIQSRVLCMCDDGKMLLVCGKKEWSKYFNTCLFVRS